MLNEDDDFYDLDKDDLSQILKNNQQVLAAGEESLPMMVLSHGFDYDDYTGDYRKLKQWKKDH